jgi:hypothetical protein
VRLRPKRRRAEATFFGLGRLKTETPACGRDRLCPPEASGGESESRVCLPSLRVMRTRRKATARWPIPARAPKRPFSAAGDGASFIWTAVGQDRLVPIFLATLAIRQQNRVNRLRSAAEMLATFGTQQGGTQYRRLMAASRQLKVERVSELRSRRVGQRFRLDVRDSTRE